MYMYIHENRLLVFRTPPPPRVSEAPRLPLPAGSLAKKKDMFMYIYIYIHVNIDYVFRTPPPLRGSQASPPRGSARQKNMHVWV